MYVYQDQDFQEIFITKYMKIYNMHEKMIRYLDL